MSGNSQWVDSIKNFISPALTLRVKIVDLSHLLIIVTLLLAGAATCS